MKKIIFTLSLFLVTPIIVLAWDDCPVGKVNSSYPGDCGKYVDTDNDGICDRSQPAPEDRNSNFSNTETIINEIDNLKKNKELEKNAETDIDVSLESKTQFAESDKSNKEHKRIYHLLPISLVLVFLYLFGYILSKRKIIKVVNHRKIWNFLLLLTFLSSGITGVLLIIRVNSGIVIPLPFDILFWHVETGIAMFVICIFHISWHLFYFKNMFRKLGKK
ncbi:hypothetical protein KAU39_03885 [bacterium]|nr:hypothetical protein [bacterium]